MKEGGHLEVLGIDKKVLLIWIIKKKDGRSSAGCLWIKTWRGGRRFWI
jgi:hypothetical protein